MDALTNLNNRGEFMRYVSRSSNFHMDDRSTVVVMMDIDKFKSINDTYGHAEGDQALVIVADALKKVIRSYSMPSFLGRYGGDEFVLIIHPENGADIDSLVSDIRKSVQDEINSHKTEYDLTLSGGYDELREENDSVQDCMKRADDKLYVDKKRRK
jgi:diguanylate cyclase (GGDEF)-like protein